MTTNKKKKITTAKKALITGITGQDGSYLAELLLEKGYEVHGIIRRASTFNTSRIDHIFQDPHLSGAKLFLHYGDLSDGSNINRLLEKIRPDEIYHLGAQSHVRVSFDIPEYTGDVTGLGTLRILDAIRETGIKTKFYQASSSEMFGKALEIPIKETTPFYPRSPYGCAKVYAYWTTKNYRESYGIFACNGILFNHECLTSQTPVILRKNGLIDISTIEEIVPHRENPRHGIKYSTVAKGNLEIWDRDKWTKIKTLTATWNKAGSPTDKKVRNIICRGGYYEATEDHISFLKDGNKIKTGDLKGGRHLNLGLLPNIFSKTIITLEESEFLGMMVGDGYISKDGKGRFVNNDNNLRSKIQELWQKITGGYSKENKHPSGFKMDRDVLSIDLSGNRDYLRMIWKEIYNGKLYKKVPLRILNANKESILAFLKGYNACDGLKGGHQKTEFKSFTTNSSVLAMGLWYLIDKTLGLRITLHPEFREDKLYFHLNINSDNETKKGAHLKRPISEIKTVKKQDYTGWLFDLETESETFSAGVGLTWVHNSPRRGETFVTRKITRGLSRIKLGKESKLYLGNLDAKRDWGYAKDFVLGMWMMLQKDKPDDYILATNETHTVREFAGKTASALGFDIIWRGKGVNEKGIDKKTGKTIIEIDPKYFRPSEVDILLGDYSKAKKELGWEPKVKFEELVEIMSKADYDAESENTK